MSLRERGACLLQQQRKDCVVYESKEVAEKIATEHGLNQAGNYGLRDQDTRDYEEDPEASSACRGRCASIKYAAHGDDR